MRFSDNSVHFNLYLGNPIQVTSLGHISGSSITTHRLVDYITTLGGNSPLNIDSPKIINGIDSMEI